MFCIVAKIGIFSSSDNKNDESKKEADISLNKSEINFKSIGTKIYICKMFKISFCITFLGL